MSNESQLYPEMSLDAIQDEVYEDGRLCNVQVPRVEYLPAAGKTACDGAVILCPGGGYTGLSMHKEGYKVAQWLNGLDMNVFLLKYRHDKDMHPTPICDLQQAIKYAKQHADDYRLSKNKIGVMGFSAGGHLASTAMVHWRHDFLNNSPGGEQYRPDFGILIYPLISFYDDIAHVGCREKLIGKNASSELVDLLSTHKHVDSDVCPTFMAHARDDISVPPQNSIVFYEALITASVPAELHIFESGGHGFGLADGNDHLSQWKTLCASWLAEMGFA